MCVVKMRILLFFVLSGASYITTTSGKHVICYYGSWATYRNGLGKFDVSNIDTSFCSHLVYSFAGINLDGEVISLDPYLDLPDNWGRDNFGKFNALKNQKPTLKTLLSVGGYNEGSAKYSLMAGSASKRKTFITTAMTMIHKHGFDGLDICWEYPARGDTIHGSDDVSNFSQLLKELREAFDVYGLILTAAVSATRDVASLSYNITNISKYLDLINVMAYDLNGPWDISTGHNSPLHRGIGDEMVLNRYLHTVDASLNYWLSEGCPPEKLILGIPIYGHSYKLLDPNKNSVRDYSAGPGITGEYTGTPGSISYNEVCQLLNKGWDIRLDEKAKVPYAVKDDNWISYDNIDSVTTKVNLVLKLNIGGVMIWSLEMDDFHGICGQEYALLKTVNEALKGSLNEIGAEIAEDDQVESSILDPAKLVSSSACAGIAVSAALPLEPSGDHTDTPTKNIDNITQMN